MKHLSRAIGSLEHFVAIIENDLIFCGSVLSVVKNVPFHHKAFVLNVFCFRPYFSTVETEAFVNLRSISVFLRLE